MTQRTTSLSGLIPGIPRRAAAGLLVAGLLGAGLLGAGMPARPANAQPPEIEYAYPDQSVWTTRISKQGEPDNPLLRLAGHLFGQAGIPWHGRGYPAARLFNLLQDGAAQFSMLVQTPVLKDCCLLSQHPVASTELRVYRFAGRTPVTRLDDLTGQRIITIRGYSYGGRLAFLTNPDNQITNATAIRHESAFAMLEAGRGDYLLDYTGPATEVLADHPIPGLVFDVLSRLEVFLVLSKNYPDAPAVMARLEAIAATLDTKAIVETPPGQ